MRKTNLSLLILLCSVSLALSQTSFGLKNPKNVAPLLSYRLPKWGYMTFILKADGNGHSTESKNKANDLINNNSLNLSFSPSITSYLESEKYIRHFNIQANSSLNYDHYQHNNLTQNEQKDERFFSSIYLEGYWKHYVKKNSFIIFNGESPQ